MSDSYILPGYGLSPEDAALYNSGYAPDPQTVRNYARIIGPGAAASAVTNFAPDPHLPGVAGYIPGVSLGERILGFFDDASGLIDKGVDYTAKKLGGITLPPNPTLPFVLKGKENVADTEQQIYKQLGGKDPETQGEEAAQAISSAVGGAVGPPGSALTRLPPAARFMANRLIMPIEHAPVNAAIGGIGTGAAEAVGAALDDTGQAQAATPDKKAAQPSVDDILKGTTQPASVQEAARQPTVDEILRGTATDATPVPSGQHVSPTVDDILSGRVTDFQPPAPTFNQQGESDVPVWKAVAGIIATGLAIGAASYTHGLGGRVSVAARAKRFQDPAYAAAAMDYENQRIARGGAEISGNEGPAPLPGDGTLRNLGVEANSRILDQNKWFENYVTNTAANPTDATKLKNQYGLSHNDMLWRNKMREFNITGVDEATGMKIPSPSDIYSDVVSLDKGRRKLLQDTLLSENEIDNRQQNLKKTGSADAYDFRNQTMQDLQNLSARGRADPVVAALADRYQNYHLRLIELGEARGFFSPQEAADLKSVRPHYVPDVDANGRIMHAFGPRTTTPYTGVEQVNAPPWVSMAQHTEALYREFELNDIRRAMIRHQLDVQNQVPGSAQFVQPVLAPNAPPTLYAVAGNTVQAPRDPTLAIRTSGGVQYYKVDNPRFYEALTQNNANKARMQMGSASVARRLVQGGTTGIWAGLSGRLFPVTNVMRTAHQMTVNAPQGMYGGVASRALGGRLRPLTAMVDAPTNVAGAGYAYLRGQADRMANMLGHAFDPAGNNFATQMLSSVLSPPRMQAISDNFKNYYLSTATHELRAGGAGGQGTPVRSELPAYTKGRGDEKTQARLVAAEQVPEMFFGKGRSFGIRLRSALESQYAALSDAGHEWFYRLNRDNPNVDKGQLVRATRELTGDPGVSGSSPTVNRITNWIPYANISAQGTARTVRQIGSSPFTTGATIATSLGGMAMASILTAMMKGPEFVNHLQNLLSTQQREANVTLYTGDSPEANMQYSLPQEYRPFYPIMLDLVSKALNLEAAVHDADSWDDAMKIATDFFSEHIESSSVEAMRHGVSDLNFINFPPIASAIGALGGQKYNVDLDEMYHQWMENGTKGVLGSMVMPSGSPTSLPNQPVGDGLYDGQDAARIEQMLSHTFGIAGSVLDELFKGVTKYQPQTGAWDKTLGLMGQDWLQYAKDINPNMNTILWENPMRLSVRPPIVESVQRSLDAMKPTATAKPDILGAGTTGGSRPLPTTEIGGGSKVPDANTDPLLHNMYMKVSMDYNWIESKLMPPISALRKQMQNVDSLAISPQQKREKMNDMTRDLADKYRVVQNFIVDTNAAISRMAGRSVDVRGIDWGGGDKQFRRISP